MGIYPVAGLVVVTLLPGCTLAQGQRPAFLRLGTSPKVYSDGPRISTASRLHMIEAASTKRLLKKVEPQLPPEARVAGVRGAVVFRIVIGTDGRVKEIHLGRGTPLLVSAAAKALSEWVFKPTTFHGAAVEVETFATVRFGKSRNIVGLRDRGLGDLIRAAQERVRGLKTVR